MRYSSHILVRVSPDLPAAIGAAAEREGVSKAEFTRRAIAARLSPPVRPRRIRPSPKLAGMLAARDEARAI